MKYPATFTEEDGGFVVTFRDIPEAITQGDDEAEALTMAKDVLVSAMEVYFDEKRQVPAPSAPQPGDRLIALPASIAVKVLLLNEMLAQQVAPSELARRMDTTRQEINRLIDLGHTSRIDRIEDAMSALGTELAITLAKQINPPAAYVPVYDNKTTTFLHKLSKALKANTPLVGRKNAGKITIQNTAPPRDTAVVEAWLVRESDGELRFYFQDGVDDAEGFDYLSFADVQAAWVNSNQEFAATAGEILGQA